MKSCLLLAGSHVYRILSLLSCLLLCSCGPSYEQLRVVQTPKPQIIAKGTAPKIMPAGFLKLRLQKQLPELEEIIINDQHYVYITEEWFLQLKKWCDTFIGQQVPAFKNAPQLPVGYRQSYAMFLSSVANITIAKHFNIKSSALIGLLVTKNIEPWGEIPGTGEQMTFIILMDDNYLRIYDLETEQISTLDNFPNKKHIIGLIF